MNEALKFVPIFKLLIVQLSSYHVSMRIFPICTSQHHHCIYYNRI